MPSLDMSMARINAAKVNFYSGEEKAGCPAPTDTCRRAAYVRAGDVVLISERRGDMVFATYASTVRETSGWLPIKVIVPQATPVQPLSGWVGTWLRDEASIVIKPDKGRGALSFIGQALYGTHDPDRVRRGAINMGDFEESGIPSDGRVMLGEVGDYQCRVAIRLIGPYLAVADNNNCGGINVSFSGTYRRSK